MQKPSERHGPDALRPSLRDDQSGLALIYVTVLLPIIIGFALLAVDVGRYMTLNSSLQHGADALALAGAAELDGSPSAITRSESAMQRFITQNTALFTSSAATVGWADVTTCYLSAIPADDATPIPDSDCLDIADNDAKEASSLATKFLRVVVDPKNYDTIFPATIIGALSNTVQTQAEAVAGFQAAACNFTPLFLCNPFEESATTSYDDHGLIEFSQRWQDRRRALRFLSVATGNTVTAVPGQYGFLDPVTGNGKKALGDEIASVSPDLCYIRDKIETKQGDMADLRNAFNTRFDLYFGSYSKNDYPPAVNVRKGYALAKVNPNNGKLQSSGANACSTNDNQLALNPNAYLGMPVDSCFKTTNCKVGNGDWKWDPDLPNGISNNSYDPAADISDVSFTKYWDTNFRTGQSSPASYPTDIDLGLGTTGAQYSDANPPPRYDVYLYENSKKVGNKLLRDFTTKSNAPKPTGKTVGVDYPATVDGEEGNPKCSNAPVSTPDRRILYGAIVNCLAEGLSPGSGGYTAFAFGKFFMIRPMQQTTNSDLWLEIVDIVRPGDGTGVARDIVQLYR